MNCAREMFEHEHRDLAAVVQGLRALVRRIRDRGDLPDFERLRAMLYYLDACSGRLHHPQEEEFLFRPLLARGGGGVEAVIDDLAREHARIAAALCSLEQGLLRYEAGGEREFVAFATAIEGFCEFYLRHMRKEESLLLPLAQELLGGADRASLEAACSAARASQERAAEELQFRQLLRRILGAQAAAPGEQTPAVPA